MPAGQRIGKVAVGVDLHHRHFRRIVNQSVHDAVGHAVLAAEAQEKLVAQRADAVLNSRQAVFELAVGRHRRQDMQTRRLGEIDQRLLVEGLDLKRGGDDRLGPLPAPVP